MLCIETDFRLIIYAVKRISKLCSDDFFSPLGRVHPNQLPLKFRPKYQMPAVEDLAEIPVAIEIVF